MHKIHKKNGKDLAANPGIYWNHHTDMNEEEKEIMSSERVSGKYGSYYCWIVNELFLLYFLNRQQYRRIGGLKNFTITIFYIFIGKN